MKNQDSVELAKIFNPPFILNSSFIPKTIRESIHKMNKQILLFEGGKTNHIEEMVVEEGFNGVKRILNHLGMRSFKIDISKDREPIFLSSSKWLRAPHSGMFQAVAENGSEVKKGEVIGILTDPFGNMEKKIKAPNDGFIICLNESPVVYKGDAIFHLAEEKD
jgi:hypothetical protein